MTMAGRTSAIAFQSRKLRRSQASSSGSPFGSRFFRSDRPEIMNVIDSSKLKRGMRAKNSTHFSSSRSNE
ncbi:hypothetical protein GOL81_17665 [Sinorhizobium medicae]|nr:hypothetical protein [Sinorhizobium medicae]MDX0566075.1 hypothetical protein [Sinorhizobium medicae]MDX0578566.1 hypothetical protein [Sinorhizobium medicae]MDX0727467.1 hypothetical protein [Sinorhizobium medicae]MDX0733691.1 hypothetical protein [Sinorhizobium medicae]